MTPDELRAIRQALALSQEGLARSMGVAMNTIARWERGERAVPPTADKALRFLAIEADADYQRWRDTQDAPLADAAIAADTTPDAEVPAF